MPDPPQIFGRGFIFASDPKSFSHREHWSDADIRVIDRFSKQPGAVSDLLTFPNEVNRAAQNQAVGKLGEENAEAAETLRGKRKPCSKAVHKRAQLASYAFQEGAGLAAALKAHGKSLDDLIALGESGITGLWSLVPSLDTDCELTLYRDRQWSRPAKSNDFFDISRLVIAIPYCDVVVVEKFWARAIKETGLAEKYGTLVCSDLGELSSLLGLAK